MSINFNFFAAVIGAALLVIIAFYCVQALAGTTCITNCNASRTNCYTTCR